MDNKDKSITKYPYNLIYAAIGEDSDRFPVTSEKNVLAGVEYVLYTLGEREQMILRKRFREGKSIEDISRELAMPVEEAEAQERRIFKSIRYPTKWNYIQYGIEGYMKKRMEEVNRTVYQNGYIDGYQKGITDGKKGISLNEAPEDILNLPVESMGLSARAYFCLTRTGCERIGDVIALRDEQIRYMRNLGPKSAGEIAAKIQQLGICNSVWDKFLI